PPGAAAPKTTHPSVQLIDAFNASQTAVKVISRTDSSDYSVVLQKTQAELAAGDAPALVTVPWAFINWASEGLGLIGLEDALTTDQVKTVFSNLRDEVIPLVTLNGKTMGVPFAFSTPVFYANKDILDKAGVKVEDVLATWEGFIDAAKPIQESNDGLPVLALMGRWPSQGIIQSNGGRVLDDNGEFQVTAPEAIAAMQAIQDITLADLKVQGTAPEQSQAFIGGSVPIYHASIASLSSIRSQVQFNFEVASFPKFGDKKRWMSCGGSFIGMFAQDPEQQQAAFEFEKFALSEPGYTIWAQVGYMNATKFDIPILPGQEPAYVQLTEGINAETPWPGARGGEIADVWDGFVNRIWDNDISADEGAKEALDQMNEIRG
ncbi:MAG TPA: extracellular solute-binding protein, partial [Thermomicrobiales bacterium]|nr:extracellular solute-binding protein [Thermomicrobiales bacterium]